MTALQGITPFGHQGKIRPGKTSPTKAKRRGSQTLLPVIRPGWSNDGIHQFLITRLGHLHVRHLLLLLRIGCCFLGGGGGGLGGGVDAAGAGLPASATAAVGTDRSAVLVGVTSTTATATTTRTATARTGHGNPDGNLRPIPTGTGSLGHQPCHPPLLLLGFRRVSLASVTGLAVGPRGTGIDGIVEVGIIEGHSVQTLEELPLVVYYLRGGFVSHDCAGSFLLWFW
mmetsp:Transcript_2959/g.6368  ORF Transcript_2959/g.6368 Transcript_2959/m.6368 type:complete len:227 (-) Transcript_2959:325-1005(-)